MSGLPPVATELRTSLVVRFVPILLQKSKIEGRRKSRESRFLETLAAAMLSEANAKVGGRLGMKRCGPSSRRARSTSAVFKTFVLHPKNTFATKYANKRHWLFDIAAANWEGARAAQRIR
jgi:hypothetical protein